MIRVSSGAVYHEVVGDGEPVILLHGGFCSLEAMRDLLDEVSSRHRVYAPERPGHGRSPDIDGPYSYKDCIVDMLAYMDAVGLGDAHLVGYSDGAIIAMLIARDHPARCRSLVCVSGNLDPTGFVGAAGSGFRRRMTTTAHTPDSDASSNDGPMVAADDPLRRAYDGLSPDGPEHADIVLAKLMHLWTHEPSIAADSLSTVAVPALIMAGDDDSIALSHSALMATSLPRGQLCIVPGSGHDVLNDRPTLAAQVITEFLYNVQHIHS